MAKKKKNEKKKVGKGRLVLYIIGFVSLIVLLSFAAVLFVLGMLPTFVASYVDNTKERNNFRVVAACNFSGVLPSLMRLFRNGEITSDAVNAMLFSPNVWLVMYGAAAFGWALVWFFPQAVHFVLNMIQDSSVRTLNEKQQSIVDEWGLDVESSSQRALRNATFSEENRMRKNAEGELPKLAGPQG